MDLTIVVVNYHTNELLYQFLDSLAEHRPLIDFAVRVQDVEVPPQEHDLSRWPFPIKWRTYSDNVGYAVACNDAVVRSRSRFFGFFNADTRFVDNYSLNTCVKYLEENPDVGAVGPLQVNSQNQVTHAGIIGTHDAPQHRGWKSPNPERFRDRIECITISGSAFVTPAKVWREMMACKIYKNMFPNATGALMPTPLYYEETAYMYHLFAHNHKVMYLGDAKMIHEWHASSPVGSQTDKFKVSQGIFREFCESHGISHD